MRRLCPIMLTAVFLLAACAPALEVPDASWPVLDIPESDPLMPYANFPIIDGSTSTLPLSRALMSYYTGITEEEAELRLYHTKTDTAYYQLLGGDVDLLIVYEGSDEVKEYMASSEIQVESKVIGYDALCILTNESNPVSALTSRQLRAIYRGDITNWSEVGGLDTPIIAYQRNDDSGSQTMFQKLVMQGEAAMDAPTELRPGAMGSLLEAISLFQNEGNAIGFSVYYYVRNMYVLPDLKILSIDGVAPSSQTIADGTYPYVNPFYAFIRADEPADSPARQIYNFLSTEEGQHFIDNQGYAAAHLS